MEQFLIQNWWFLVALIAWSLPWKAAALWRAARLNGKLWFIALLVVNSLGLLEILYIFVFSKRKALAS